MNERDLEREVVRLREDLDRMRSVVGFVVVVLIVNILAVLVAAHFYL